MAGVAAHRQNGFNPAFIDLIEGAFDHPGEEREGADGDGHHRRGAAERGADDNPGERDQGDEQDNKRQRAPHVNDAAKHLIKAGGREHRIPAGQEQQDAER
ncbi:hypothetical protein BBAD15_g297 [Beauveria bassiana D1-5]|uniref:Uncharacterized protein n=1 Tax=Beauveria bassiana D1-5 TaxID=1245745 RepID=A0A0A2W0Y6_BEABA|nr:hypothetical protein BBAD15_g297 [Beauveria bassiana D1-5]